MESIGPPYGNSFRELGLRTALKMPAPRPDAAEPAMGGIAF
jgi:hypothetical protein